MFALGAVTPIILIVALGYGLKKGRLINEQFVKMANKLVFRVFLPAMLFLNIYNIKSVANIQLGYIIYAVAVLVFVFFAALVLVHFVTDQNKYRGVLLQASFRSNYALIGIPLAVSLFGDEGGAVATLLSAVTIPIFNALAVVSLAIFNGDGKRPSVKKILLDIAKNPFIQSIAAGLVCLGVRAAFVNFGIEFRLSDIGFVFTALKYLSNVATPLALLVLGAQFEFSAIAEMKKEIIFGTVARVLATPLIGIAVAYLFFRNDFGGAQFASFIALFATPVAVSSVPMAQELGGDTTLAGQLVVWTTLFSAASIFIASFLLKLAGIF